MKKNYQQLCLIFLTGFILLICSSCTPDDKNPVKAEAVGKNVSLDKEKELEKNVEKPLKEHDSNLSVVSEPGGKDFLLFHESSQTAVFPEDFKIGPLQQEIDMDDTEFAINVLVSEFTASVFADKPDSNMIYSKRRQFVMRNLSESFENTDFSSYRLGVINIDSEPAMADIRFLGNDSFSDGTVYFYREEGWKIFDLQITEPDSGINEKIPNEKWFPIYNKVK